MNKKAQIDFDDPMQLLLGIVYLFFALIIMSLLIGVLANIGCEDELRQIDSLKRDLSLCQSQIQNQSLLEQNLNNQCNERVNQTTINITTDLNEYKIIVKEYKMVFLLYHISIIFSFVFGISLFKIVFAWKIHTHNKKLKIFLKGIKIVWVGLWIILTISFIFLFLYTLFYLFFPHWFV